MYRFKYTQDSEASILTNLGGYLGNSTMTQAEVKKVNNTEFEGSFFSSGRLWGGPKEIKVFFVVQFDKSFESPALRLRDRGITLSFNLDKNPRRPTLSARDACLVARDASVWLPRDPA